MSRDEEKWKDVIKNYQTAKIHHKIAFYKIDYDFTL